MKFAGSHEHMFREVARQSGKRVRYKCDTCPKLGPWIVFTDSKDVPVQFDTLTVPELRERARVAAVVGFSRMRKAELVKALSDA